MATRFVAVATDSIPQLKLARVRMLHALKSNQGLKGGTLQEDPAMKFEFKLLLK